MNNKHTPGPWEWNELDQLVATSVFDENYGDEQRPVVIVETDSGFYPPRANDRPLIAAAPDLLEALLDMVSDRDCLSEATVKFARAAIAKATGAQP